MKKYPKKCLMNHNTIRFDPTRCLYSTASFQHEFWIDGSDLLVEGHFVWASTQSDMDYTNWAKGEPNDLNGEDCVEIVHNSDNFTWNDAPCDTLQHFICERP
ncbi:hypothetical protein FSP39_008201 [Pinctada imbricata]|uniref:C-type lectin domain-containing protein n=1 Tax=Pinctada imbricata TaxID=66713 RepID=A0AA89BLQ4_PINIB|nr:hypothetical protein FSP39_008201 [Pinctada imbricata]